MKTKKIIIGLSVFTLITVFNICNAFLINPNQLNIREETLKSTKFDSSFDGYIIAYFSDLNYSDKSNKKDLNALVDKINDINPDVVIFGGDLIYSFSGDDKDLSDALTIINAKVCKYAVLGEEDKDRDEKILTDSDFVILNNEIIQLYSANGSFINLIGLNINDNSSDISGTSNAYNLVVSHYPDNYSNISFADYVLAGHSLGGRVYFPIWSTFNTVDGAHKYYRGKHNINGTILDVTNGVGTKEKGNRFNADAELVFYKIEAN